MASFDKSGVYRITCLVTGSFYVGSSTKIYKRWYQHRMSLRAGTSHCRNLQRAWTEHGEAALTFEVIEDCAREFLKEREQFYFDVLQPDYNHMVFAGERPNAAMMAAIHAKAMTPAMRAQISAKLTGRVVGPPSAAHRQRISQAKTGAARTIEARAALSAGQRAKNLRDDLAPQANNRSSGVRGITWDASKKKWAVVKMVHKGMRFLRRFDDLAIATLYVDRLTQLAKATSDFDEIKATLAREFPVDRDAPHRGSESGIRGVRFDKRTGRWMARAKGVYLGMFATAQDAEVAVKSSMRKSM